MYLQPPKVLTVTQMTLNFLKSKFVFLWQMRQERGKQIVKKAAGIQSCHYTQTKTQVTDTQK